MALLTPSLFVVEKKDSFFELKICFIKLCKNFSFFKDDYLNIAEISYSFSKLNII